MRRVVLGIAAAAGSYIAAGSILDAVSNALALVNWRLTIAGTLVLFALWVGLRVVLRRHAIQWQNYQVRRLRYYPACAFIGVILLLWTPPLLRGLKYYSPPPPVEAKNNKAKEAKIVVLVSEFAGVNPQGYGVTDIMFEQLIDAVKGYRDVKLKRLQESIYSSDSAHAKGKEGKADIVLWGSYLTNNSETRVTIHFEVVDSRFDDIVKNGKQTLKDATARFENFAIQERVSKEMSYLVLLTVGLARFEAADVDAAIEALNRAISLSTGPEQILEPHDIYAFRGACYIIKGDLTQAISDLSLSIQHHPDGQALFNRGIAFGRQGKLNEALQDLNSSILMDYKDGQVYRFRGEIYLYKHDLDKALADLNKAVEINTVDALNLIIRAKIFLEQQRFDAAIADIKSVSSLCFDSESNFVEGTLFNCPEDQPHWRVDLLNVLGKAFEGKGDLAKAIANYSSAIKYDPTDFVSYMHRATAYLYNDQLDNALADLDVAISLKPDHRDLYDMRGQIHLRKGNVDAALEDYTTLIRVNGDRSSWWAYMARGVVYASKGDVDRAIADFSHSIAAKPSFEAYVNRCNAYLLKQRFHIGMSDCDRAIKLEPANAEAYLVRASGLLAMRLFARAVRDLNKALELDPRKELAYANRGLAYESLMKKDSAIADYKKFIALSRDWDNVRTAQARLCGLDAGYCQ